MALDDPTIARVGRNGYRVIAPLEPGMRTSLDRPGVLDVEHPFNPVAERADRVTQANKTAGYTS